MIESKDSKEGLKKLKENQKNIDYILAATGSKVGEIYFDNRNPIADVLRTSKP